MASSNFGKDIPRELAVLEAKQKALDTQIRALNEERTAITEKIKHLRPLLPLYEPPSPKRKPTPKREKAAEKITQAAPADDQATDPGPPGPTGLLGPPGVVPPIVKPASSDQPTPSIAPTVMNVERPPGQAATSLPSEGPLTLPTTERLRGSR